MKKIPMRMVLGYLIISITLAFAYKRVPVVPDETTEAWRIVAIEAPNGPEVLSTPIPASESAKELKAEADAIVTVALTAEPEITAEPVITPTSAVTPTPAITPEPVITPTPAVTLTSVPTGTPEPIQQEESAEVGRETVKYEGKEIGYINTSYRIDEETLEQIVSMVRKEPYTSAFVLYDINSEATICYNEEKYFPVASTVKAPFAMTCLWQVEEGVYSLEDTMVYTEKYKVRGTGVIKNEKFGKVYTIKELVEHAIELSDDIGYLMLQGYFGYEKYNEFLKNMGNRVTIGGGVKWGHTSARDSLRNWQEIYRYINSDGENAAFFASLLKNTNKSYIRNVLGEEYEVFNKMGWVQDQCCHDHAIVMDEQPYLLIIMTMGDVRAGNETFMEDLAILLNDIHEEMVAE